MAGSLDARVGRRDPARKVEVPEFGVSPTVSW